MPRKAPAAQTVAPSPFWTLDDGISFSLLSRFLACRERYRLYAVEGLRETSSSKAQMDFGTYFHKCLELKAKHPNKTPDSIFKLVKHKLPELDMTVAKIVFRNYYDYYHDDTFKYHDQEAKFDVPYTIPGGPKFRLRGRFDEIIMLEDRTLMIQENKTKERINEEQLGLTIPFNLQTMFYAIAASIHYKKPVSAILYNVIRKPKNEPLKSKKETLAQFAVRLDKEIRDNPRYYFIRWDYTISDAEMAKWKNYTFHPILLQLRQWWESIKHDPFSPWLDVNGILNPHHYQRPFGVYDSLTTGTGDFFNLITRKSRVGLTENNIPFQELID